MGLFGLSIFIAEMKTKEIGIRKVLGASLGSIITLQLKEYAVLIFVSFIIAFAIARFAMNS